MKVDIYNTDKKYNIIYADPPWSYKDKCNAGRRGAEFKYQCMDIESIKSLPVDTISHDDAVLFLWVTFPMLQEGLDTIKSWGFTYKTVAFNWIKRNKISDTVFMGMGNWTRSNSEICLLAVRGKPHRESAGVHSVIVELPEEPDIIFTPIEKHSKKPDETRARIVSLVGDVPRIELFARQRITGWDCWGNEV